MNERLRNPQLALSAAALGCLVIAGCESISHSASNTDSSSDHVIFGGSIPDATTLPSISNHASEQISKLAQATCTEFRESTGEPESQGYVKFRILFKYEDKAKRIAGIMTSENIGFESLVASDCPDLYGISLR